MFTLTKADIQLKPKLFKKDLLQKQFHKGVNRPARTFCC